MVIIQADEYGLLAFTSIPDLEWSPYLSIPADLTLKTGVGIWHVNRHIPECFIHYAPLFIVGVGHVDGEILETLWSSLNKILLISSLQHHYLILSYQI